MSEKFGLSGSSHDWASTTPGRTNAQTASTCPSVCVSSTWPHLSQITVETPSVRRSSASISSLPRDGLRFGCRRHCSVVISVPSPSTVIEPPSRIIDDSIRSTPSVSSSFSETAASRSYGRNRSPHELNLKSTPAIFPRPSVTKIGPESRIHESSIGISTTSTFARARRPNLSALSRRCHHRHRLEGRDRIGGRRVLRARLLRVSVPQRGTGGPGHEAALVGRRLGRHLQSSCPHGVRY